MNFETRITDGRDIPASDLSALATDSIHTLCAADYPPEALRAWAAKLRHRLGCDNALSEGVLRVAIHGVSPLGFAYLHPHDCVDLLYVHKDFLNRGIAKGLLAEMESACLHHGHTSLKTYASITAKPFFGRMGFRCALRQSVVIGEQRLVNFKMVKKLSPKAY